MVDQNSQFYAILTQVGAAKQANADALGIAWSITHLGVGDANGTDPMPEVTQTGLINEWRRAPLNQLKVDDKNPAIIVAEQIIPADVGGRWIRELALYDADGDMVAVANCAPTYKPLLSQGSGRTQVVRMSLIVSSTSNVVLKVDPSVVLATREYVDSRIAEELNKLDHKQSVRVATSTNVVLSGLQTIDGVRLTAGDRVLVKNQAVAKDNGLYLVSATAWPRAADADSNAEVTPGLIVPVEQGAVLADTIWQLVTDGPVLLGSTALSFRDITDGFARLLSPVFSGAPEAPTPPQFDNSNRLATTGFVQRALGSYAGVVTYNGNVELSGTDVGHLISVQGMATVVTLPDAAQVPQGALIAIRGVNGAMTVRGASGQVLTSLNGASGPFTLAGASLGVFRRLASNDGWILEGGDAALGYSALFASQLGPVGWSMRPDGLIEQWGAGQTDEYGVVHVTFPLAFPSGVAHIAPMHLGTLSLMHNIMHTSVTKTGCRLRVQGADGKTVDGWTITWRALGY